MHQSMKGSFLSEKLFFDFCIMAFFMLPLSGSLCRLTSYTPFCLNADLLHLEKDFSAGYLSLYSPRLKPLLSTGGVLYAPDPCKSGTHTMKIIW